MAHAIPMPAPRAPKTKVKLASPLESKILFDLPVTYNKEVKHWLRYFQGQGRKWFRRWLERSTRHVPMIQKVLARRGLPLDLAYLAMIESGFSSYAVSSAAAVGPWQFIRSTGEQYGLQSNWWLDERRDFEKSTHAAADYLGHLYKLFNSWHLAAAAYNMGENRLKRLIRRHRTNDFWQLSQKRDFANETKDYIPKLIAAILISKTPKLYGFRDLLAHKPLRFERIEVPGGLNLTALAQYLSVHPRHMKNLNPELIKGSVPKFVPRHTIRIPRHSKQAVLKYLRLAHNYPKRRLARLSETDSKTTNKLR